MYNVERIDSDAVLYGTVEVIDTPESRGDRGLHEASQRRRHIRNFWLANRKRPRAPMPGVGAVRSIFQRLVCLEHLIEIPPSEAMRLPSGKIGRASSFGYGRVDGRTAAQHLAALCCNRAAKSRCLSHVAPVEFCAAAEIIGIRKRLGKTLGGIRTTGFKKQNLKVGMCAQAVGQHASCRPPANNGDAQAHDMSHRARNGFTRSRNRSGHSSGV